MCKLCVYVSLFIISWIGTFGLHVDYLPVFKTGIESHAIAFWPQFKRGMQP